MENTSAQKNSINVFLGEDIKYIELPSKVAGTLPQKFIIYPIRMSDIAKIETFSNIDFVEWERKNPFSKLTVMMYAMWLSVSKNDKLSYTEQQFNDLFEIAEMESMFKLLKVILDISGLTHLSKKDVEEKKDVELT